MLPAQLLQGAAPVVSETLEDAFRSHRNGNLEKSAVAGAAKPKVKGISREVYNLLGPSALPPMVSMRCVLVACCRLIVRFKHGSICLQVPERQVRAPAKPIGKVAWYE